MAGFKVSTISTILKGQTSQLENLRLRKGEVTDGYSVGMAIVSNIAYLLADEFTEISSTFDSQGWLRECGLRPTTEEIVLEMPEPTPVRVIKKRGRPVGSKNRPKVDAVAVLNTKIDTVVERVVKGSPQDRGVTPPPTMLAWYKIMSESYADALTMKFAADKTPHKFSVEHGYKFDKVISGTGKTGNINRGVHCFVDKSNGDVIKAASYKAPARRVDKSLAVMGNIGTYAQFDRLVNKADAYGSYLYTR